MDVWLMVLFYHKYICHWQQNENLLRSCETNNKTTHKTLIRAEQCHTSDEYSNNELERPINRKQHWRWHSK